MIDHLDHLVLTTAHEADCIRFYTQALGMRLETFVGGTPPVERKAFAFGAQKINLHVKGREFEPRASAVGIRPLLRPFCSLLSVDLLHRARGGDPRGAGRPSTTLH